MKPHSRVIAATAALAGITLLATACASATTESSASDDSAAHTHDTTEGRIAVSYEGGIAVLDPESLEVLDTFPTEEFTRLNPFGDGRTVAVTTSAGFQMLDTSELHLTDLVFDAKTAGHVVVHEGKTVLYDDGTGTTTILDTDAFAHGYSAPAHTSSYTAESAHHGVSIVLSDGTLLTTVGDSNARSGAVALHPHDDHWHEEAMSNECPGIHGEGTAAHEAVVFGCENGALVYHEGEFVKLTAPDEYGRMGNAFVSDTSPLVVGDYKNDPDAEGYLLSAVTLIDTERDSLKVVNLPEEVRYTFRDMARGPGDLAYILSTDGQIHVLDPESGALTDAYPVIDPWEGPAAWQDAHPAIKVDGEVAYITDPATKSVHSVDLTSGKVLATGSFDFVPNELAIALG